MRLERSLDGIAAVAGRDAALTLARRHGGRVIRVPTTEKALAVQPWCRDLTEEAAAAIGKTFAGDNLYIPSAKKAVGRWLIEQGLSSASIAAELKVSVRTVQRWIRRA
ncbi:MAG: helix-turn-helix domain-containing protein [Deltaproteobacteria bacterium]|nr:helix-turn-helix domain-containing protein [Deltaproteobacteria bacterium]